MSQPHKRSAVEAFGDDAANTTRKSKSGRRKDRVKPASHSNAPTGVVNSKSHSSQKASSAASKSTKPSHTSNSTPAKKARVTNNAISQNQSPTGHAGKKSQSKGNAEVGHNEKKQEASKRSVDKVDKPGKEVARVQKSSIASQPKQSSHKKITTGSTNTSKSLESNNGAKRSSHKKSEQRSGKQQTGSVDESKSSAKKQRKVKAHTSRDPSKWSRSVPTGGTFIKHDPIITSDEQHLILATTKDIQVYATKSSLLVRTISAGMTTSIVSYAQLPNASQHIVVGFENGTIKKFDWTTGERIWTKRLDNHIISVTPTSSDEQGDSFLVVLELEDKQTAITSLTVDFNGEQTGLRPMLSKNILAGRVCFSAELGIAVVCTQNLILVGRLEGEGAEANLRWDEISVPDKIVCFDAQMSIAPRKISGVKNNARLPSVVVAVGLKSGVIQIYNDLLNKKDGAKSHVPQRLHWHRNAPRAVKFSPDSKYLVSGGDETVLVMWQLDTNQKQVLPHLTSAILDLTISTPGSAYALRLADNSVMVLSTSDLKPSANVSGLAVDLSSIPFLPDASVPAKLHPQHSEQLLIAYSPQALTPGLRPSEKSMNMLQTYDVPSGLQLSRQALARSLASTINVGGNGQIIHEPDVTHLDVTHDGKWLITVDQWSPIPEDLDQLYLSRGDGTSRASYTEIFLRFWSTSSDPSGNTSTSSWELNTRIDQPVSVDYSASATEPAVLAVAVSPVRLQVAIVDTTSHLKIYSPKARVKGGLPVKDINGQQLFSWTCDKDIDVNESSQSLSPRSASLAFSNDGSIIAVTWATTSDASARVHFIEPKTGKQITSLPDIVSAGQSNLAFCGQNLVALSSKLVLLDMVTMQSQVVFSVPEDFPGNRFDSAKSKLAVNTRSGIAAVSLSERDTRKASHLFLYDVRSAVDSSVSSSSLQATHKERVSESIQILLAENDNGGFLIVDGEGRSSKLSPPVSSLMSSTVALKSDLDVTDRLNGAVAAEPGRLENIFGGGRKQAGTEMPIRTTGQTNGAGVDGKMSLEDVFRFERSSDVPGPMDLFGRVVEVVGGVGA